jgi:hypothetical protein
MATVSRRREEVIERLGEILEDGRDDRFTPAFTATTTMPSSSEEFKGG